MDSYSNLHNKKIGELYFLEYIEIPNVFSWRWRQQGNRGNTKCNSGTKGNNVIRGHF
jgi:hypothetical protein